MSNMNDAVGLCVPYSKPNNPYETEFEPASGTVWTYLNPKGVACYSLEFTQAMCAHDEQLAVNGGRIDVEGEMRQVDYYVTCSRTPGVFNLGGEPSLCSCCSSRPATATRSRSTRSSASTSSTRAARASSAPRSPVFSLVQGDALGEASSARSPPT